MTSVSLKPEKAATRAVAVLLLILFLPLAGSTQVQEKKASPLYAQQDVILGITLPWQDVVLGSVKAGRIAQILVEEGQTVEAGMVLATLDNATQLARHATQLAACGVRRINVSLDTLDATTFGKSSFHS